MQVFNITNSKAKGLSSSLLDFHDIKLLENVGKERPELVLAIRLNDDPASPWFKQLDLGGDRTSGMTRRASLRTMQKSIKRFLRQSQFGPDVDLEEVYCILLGFWRAITLVFSEEWQKPRKHFLNKGVGVYALMTVASDLYAQAFARGEEPSERFFVATLSRFIKDFDWSNSGPLKGLGGEAGVREAVTMLRACYPHTQLTLVSSVKNG